MHTETEHQPVTHTETANSIFQVLTIAMIGAFTLAETVRFFVGMVA